jgi:O-antigen/teichoic acid export membrane protein
VLPFIFQLLKPDYLPALETYKILSIGSVFGYNAVLRSSHFTLIGKGQILMQTQLITVIVNVILNYSLIKMMGMNGAAAATVIAQILSLFISNLFYKDARFVFKAQVKAFNPWYIFKK